jgi:hypothetical protein
MSVPSTDLKHKYEGTGSQTEWPFTFKVFDKTQLLVKKIVGSVETELVLDVDYTVAGAGSDTGGGTVTYPIVGTALAVGEYIVIKPNFAFSQDLVLRNQNTFPPKPVEYAFDKVVMLLKQVKESLDRALQVSDAYDGDADSFITLITSPSSEILASLSGTSTTSLAIGTGSKTFVTQSGKTWSVGQRLRAVSDDATKLMEGEVTAYSGTSLTLDVDYTEGAGTHADWNISLTGARGASGSGSGDVVAANNGSDFASAATTFANLKQAATEAVTGVSRIATLAETLAGLVTDAFVAPVNLIPAIVANNTRPLLATYNLSSVATADIVDILDSDYDTYEVELDDIIGATDGQNVQILTSSDNGGTWATSAGSYSYAVGLGEGTSGFGDIGNSSATFIQMNNSGSNAVNEGLSAKIIFYNVNSSAHKLMTWDGAYTSAAGNFYWFNGAGKRRATSVINAVRIKMSSGNIASGRIRVYGIKK